MLSLGQTPCLLVFVFVFNRCLCLPVFFCLPVVCVYGPLNAVLFSQASFPDPDGQFPDPDGQFPDPMVDFQTPWSISRPPWSIPRKRTSSQKRSHRNSGQNRPIERSTAPTGTIFVTFSVFMSRGPKVDPDLKKHRHHKHARTGILCRMVRLRNSQL